jgi:hypothetical protein
VRQRGGQAVRRSRSAHRAGRSAIV